MNRSRLLAILAAMLMLTACATDTTRTPFVVASTPSLAPAITQTPRYDAHRVIKLDSLDPAPRLSWSSDSRYLAVSDRDGFSIWDTSSEIPVAVVEKPQLDDVVTSEFSLDGRLISLVQCPISPNRICDLLILDWAADEVLDTNAMPIEHDLAWSPEGDQLAWWSASRDKIFFWVDPSSGEEVLEDIEVPSDIYAANLVWLPNGILRMMAFNENGSGIWNSFSAQLINPYPDSGAFASYMDVLSADGSRSITILRGGEIGVWDATNGSRLQTIPFPKFSANHVAINADGSTVGVSSNADATINVFDVATGGLIATLPTKDLPLMIDLTFSPDGRTLASSYLNGEVHLWDLPSVQTAAATITPIPTYTPHPTLGASVQSVSFDAPIPEYDQNGMQISTGAWVDNQTLRIKYFEYGNEFQSPSYQVMDVDIASQSRVAIREATEAEMYPYDLSPDGTRYVHSERNEDDNSVRSTVIDVQSGETLYELPYDPYSQERLHWSPDQRLIYIGDDYEIKVFDARDGTYIGNLANPLPEPERIYDWLIISLDCKWAASITYTEEINVVIWDLETRQIAQTLPYADYHELSNLGWLMWSHDSSRLVMVYQQGIQVLDIASGQIEREMHSEVNGDPIWLDDGFAYWSSDGQWMIHRGYINVKEGDSLMYAWNIDTGEQRVLMRFSEGQGSPVWQFEWHPQRALFATADIGGEVYLATLDGAMAQLNSPLTYLPLWMDWSPDGRSLSALGEDGTITVWTFDSLP